jgi:hypothetical protein
MAYTINNLLTDISTVTHGTTTNKIPNIYGIISRAARDLLLDVDPKETIRTVTVPAIFNGVYDYTTPADVKGDNLIDIRPQVGRQYNDQWEQTYSDNFDRTKSLNNNNQFTVEWSNGNKTMRIEGATLTQGTVISDTSSITGWTPAVTLNTFSYPTQTCIQFDTTATPTYNMSNSTLLPIDISANVGQSTVFVWVYLPNGSAYTGFTLKWGSSISDYYTKTVTTNQQGLAFYDGWNLLAFEYATATTVGSPNVKAVSYLDLQFAYDSVAQIGVMISQFTSTAGYIYQLMYYSKYMFRNAISGAFEETVSDVTDNGNLINLDTESYNLMFNKTAFYTTQVLQGADSDYDATFWSSEYDKSLKRYRALNPSMRLMKAEPYYTMPRKSRIFRNGIY